jgi:hypothetical protein
MPEPTATRRRGRPAIGTHRVECVVSQAVWDALKKQEKATGLYHTELARRILSEQLIGGVVRK